MTTTTATTKITIKLDFLEANQWYKDSFQSPAPCIVATFILLLSSVFFSGYNANNSMALQCVTWVI